MADLFDKGGAKSGAQAARLKPLADRMRPSALKDVIGQDHILAPQTPLGLMVAAKKIASLILWGPPGVGKTTIARLLAEETDLHFQQISAIFSGVGELKKVFDMARMRAQNGQGTLLFVDEIHRFNKAQQDGFLPYMEEGIITLVGATTENPSFELNAALLSRAQTFILHPLSRDALQALLRRAEKHLSVKLPLAEDGKEMLLVLADGDGRALLNMVEQIADWKEKGGIDAQTLGARLMRRAPKYDKGGDAHYNLISALHKSVRGSDPDAALYWLARMLDGDEDPRYLARRIARIAVEDISLADPQALRHCLDAWAFYERVGSPEGELGLANAVIYLALAPKSNAPYRAFQEAMRDAKKTSSKAPPKHILNAPTKLMKEQGFGAGYMYDHDEADGFSGQNYFPDDMARGVYYVPKARGFERELKARLEYFLKLRAKRGRGKEGADK